MDPAGTCRGSALLGAWAELLGRLEVGACRLLELEHCPQAAAGAKAWCTPAGWALLAAVVLLAAAALASAGWRLVLSLSARDGSRMVAVAGECLAELRKAQQQAYPSERHMFSAAPAGEMQ